MLLGGEEAISVPRLGYTWGVWGDLNYTSHYCVEQACSGTWMWLSSLNQILKNRIITSTTTPYKLHLLRWRWFHAPMASLIMDWLWGHYSTALSHSRSFSGSDKEGDGDEGLRDVIGIGFSFLFEQDERNAVETSTKWPLSVTDLESNWCRWQASKVFDSFEMVPIPAGCLSMVLPLRGIMWKTWFEMD